MAHNRETIIDARGICYRELNARLRDAVSDGIDKVELQNVHGQRYIGTDLNRPVEIEIFGTPGNDLGAFMDGPRIVVHGNAQDGCGNTMNSGEMVVHGQAGDIIGLSAQGGKIFVRDDVGYRAGIHMKEYGQKKPALVIGGTAQDFLGEYMAGGTLVLLGLNLTEGQHHRANFIGTGMHGGTIYIRGSVADHQLGREVGVAKPGEADLKIIGELVDEYVSYFGGDVAGIIEGDFIKIYPRFLRPYGRLYTH